MLSLQALLKSDQLNMNELDIRGNTVLHSMMFYIKDHLDSHNEKIPVILETMKEMIMKGADVNKADDQGHFPLHQATSFFTDPITHPTELIELFLNAPNIQVDVQDTDGCTSLHYLVCRYLISEDPLTLNSLTQQISLFVQHGARVDLKSKPWEKPQEIDESDNEQKEKIFKIFKDQAGKSVFELAEASGNNNLIELLKRRN